MLLAGNGFLLTGGGQMSPARLLRLAGLVSVAAGVLLVVTQLLFSLLLVVADGDPVRHARSALVGVNGLLTLLAVSLLLLAGAWWWEAFAVPYAAEQAPALVAATPTGRLLAGRIMSFGVFALGWMLLGWLVCGRGSSRATPLSC